MSFNYIYFFQKFAADNVFLIVKRGRGEPGEGELGENEEEKGERDGEGEERREGAENEEEGGVGSVHVQEAPAGRVGPGRCGLERTQALALEAGGLLRGLLRRRVRHDTGESCFSRADKKGLLGKTVWRQL